MKTEDSKKISNQLQKTKKKRTFATQNKNGEVSSVG
jgi:hypothetical protein